MCIEILSDILGAGLAALSPVAIPVRSVRAALAVLAAGDTLQSKGHRAGVPLLYDLSIAALIPGGADLAEGRFSHGDHIR